MAEIKSTLDLVLEKTRHLNLSSEEKQKQSDIEIGRKIKGLVQKYQDGTIARQKLHQECERLKKEYKQPDESLFITEILNHLDLDQDNRALIGLLKDLYQLDPAQLEALFDDYREALEAVAAYRKVKLREDLAQKYRISGSAVVPNLAADAEWNAESREIRAKFVLKLAQVKADLTAVQPR
jgi:hypothetical protein